MNKKLNKVIVSGVLVATLVTSVGPMINVVHAEDGTSAKEIGIESNELLDMKIGDEVVFSKEDIRNSLIKCGISEEGLKAFDTARETRKEGVNKIVKVKGGYDVYLSKSTLTALKGGTTAFLTAFAKEKLGAVLTGNLLLLAASALAGAIAAVIASPTDGMIFRVREKTKIIGAAGVISEYYVASKAKQ